MKKTIYILLAAVCLILISPFGGKWFYLNNIRILYVLLLSCLLSFLLTPLAGKMAEKFKILDYPDKRKIHKKPIPRTGGLAVFAAFMFTMIRNQHFPDYVVGILIGASLIFVIGFLDDIFNLSAFIRLLVQVLAGCIVIIFGTRITVLPPMPGEYFLESLLTLFWIVGITNAINFLDGMDGLAAGLSLISALCFFVITWIVGDVQSGYLMIALIGASAGFIYYNAHPARIFLGDSGATLLGFLLASFAVAGTLGSPDPVRASVIPLLILGIPIYDMIYITISRVKNGVVTNIKEWIEYTGKDHFHHRLLTIGFTQRNSAVFLFSLNLCLGIGATVLANAGSREAALLFAQALIIFAIVTILMITGRRIS